MANTTIPQLPSATGLNGSEQFEAVQSNTSVRLTTNQIAQYTASLYPAPGISSVTASSPLSSTTVSGAVTITLPTAAISNTYLAQMSAGTVKANLTGGTASPSDVTPSAILDTFGTTVGSLLYRGSSNWQLLAPSTNNYVLATQGSGNAPHWITLALGQWPMKILTMCRSQVVVYSMSILKRLQSIKLQLVRPRHLQVHLRTSHLRVQVPSALFLLVLGTALLLVSLMAGLVLLLPLGLEQTLGLLLLALIAILRALVG
jgi:hypothetical protein